MLALSSATAFGAIFTPAYMVNKKAPASPFYPGAGAASEAGATGLPGDVGFDPLGLANFDLLVGSATDKSRSAAFVMRDYREAELKHGRLAMLAAVAWPLQEKLNPILAAKFHMPNLVAETGGLSPSVLNGGLEQSTIPGAVITFAALVSLIEAQGIRLKEQQGGDWVPGDYGWRSPNDVPKGSEQFFSLQSGEIWNGRIAMMAVLAYVTQEAVTGIPTSFTIPFLG